MTAAPNATRMTANKITNEREMLAREAQDIAETAARYARDVATGRDSGDAQRIAQDAQRLAIRAASVAAMEETAGMFTADLATQQ